MAQQTPPQNGNYIILEGAAWLGRLLGLIIVAIALAISSKAAADAPANQVWAFLEAVVTPMGIGFLILVGAESMSRLGRR